MKILPSKVTPATTANTLFYHNTEGTCSNQPMIIEETSARKTQQSADAQYETQTTSGELKPITINTETIKNMSPNEPTEISLPTSST